MEIGFENSQWRWNFNEGEREVEFNNFIDDDDDDDEDLLTYFFVVVVGGWPNFSNPNWHETNWEVLVDFSVH